MYQRSGCSLAMLETASAILTVQVSTGALLVAPVTTEEGEHIPLHPVHINFGIIGDSTEVPFLWSPFSTTSLRTLPSGR